jgi:tRNA A37 threonylcarbamoyladenosine synthetase subunit TsaC/SUA5/YrdC
VVAAFGAEVAVYLCADAPLEGAASSVVDLAHGEPRMLRPGAVSETDVREALAKGSAGRR